MTRCCLLRVRYWKPARTDIEAAVAAHHRGPRPLTVLARPQHPCHAAIPMAMREPGKSLFALLEDDRELFGKPHGARRALVCPHPDTPDPLVLGPREGTYEQPILGLDGGEGSSCAMDVAADVWWVVEPLASELPLPMLCYSTGQVEIHRVNVEFAGRPCEAVDHLVRTLMHPSAEVFGATIYTTKRHALAAVGDLGVAISTDGSAHAGRGGVAISTLNETTVCVGAGGIAIGIHGSTAISGECGQSYTGARGVSRSGRDGVAVAGAEGRATGTHVVVSKHGEAEVLSGHKRMFAAGVGSRVHVDGHTLLAGADFEPGLAYRVRSDESRPQIERIPELDAFVEHARINASCAVTTDALVRYFLDERPLCSAAAREHGVWWTHALRNEHGVLELPPGTREYLDHQRRWALDPL